MKVIITGSTGMVGEGVLLRCLSSPLIDQVCIINRRSLGIIHPKLKEILLADFNNIDPIKDELIGYHACFFCAGVTSVGKSEQEYTKLTYDLTTNFADGLSLNNGDMTFCYVSGNGTDSSEQGRLMWARVKGRTENELMRMPFKAVYAFRPGFINPIQGQKNILKFFKYIAWVFPIGRAIAPGAFVKVEEIADSMIEVSKNGFKSNVLEGNDIIASAKLLNI